MRRLLLPLLALGLFPLLAACGGEAAASFDEASRTRDALQLEPVKSCYSDKDCAADAYCDTENYCDSACEPGMECPAVCVGRCMPLADELDPEPTLCLDDEECAEDELCDTDGICDSPCEPGMECPAVCYGHCTAHAASVNTLGADVSESEESESALSIGRLPLPKPEPTTPCLNNDACAEGQVCDTRNFCDAPPGCRPGMVCPDVCYGRCVEPTLF